MTNDLPSYDAVVIGAGHNGLTAALLLQRAGLRTLCLESKRYAGGMASTVELFDGYKFEIAGSVQLPTSAVVSKELGLDTLPQVDLEVMSVSLIDETVTVSVAARQLSARERKVLALRFIHDMTQTQIAKEIGVSQMQVSRILRRALSHLRELTEAPGEATP